MFERILIPLDGSDLAEQALPYALEMAAKFRARVTLLRATTAETEALRETLSETTLAAPDLSLDVARGRTDSESAAAAAYLEGIAGRLSAGGVAVETKVVEGKPEWAILTQAREMDASLIAMATHGRGGLGRLVFGSVADAVLRETSIPVLLVRARGDSS